MEKMTFQEFIQSCCVPDDWAWQGISPNIKFQKENLAVIETVIHDDPTFEIKEESREGFVISWEGDDTLITDSIYQNVYIIVEIVSENPPVEAVPANTDFFYTQEEAEKELKFMLED